MDYQELDPKCLGLVDSLGFGSIEKCKAKILVVTDKAIYEEGEGAHLSELLKALGSGSLFLNVEVFLAYHRTYQEPKYGSTEALNSIQEDFTFDDSSLADLAEVWLFGFESGDGLARLEMEAISKFMEKGGGVFATGDHNRLGSALCGQIPRVRSMRRWATEPAPPDMGLTRIDSRVGDELYDAIPQTIYPTIYRSPYDWEFAPRECPHPVLCGPLGSINVLPDHEHEVLVEVPKKLNADFVIDGKPYAEYPNYKGKPLPPEVIAHGINQRDGSCFGVVGAYDGHLIEDRKRGRIVVDSSWHHFINENLNQYRYHFQRAQAAYQNGSVPDPKSLEAAGHYSQIRAYFKNTARWLAKPSVQSSLQWKVLCALRKHSRIEMALESEKPENPLPYLLDLGVKARQALRGVASDHEFWSLSKHLAESVGLDGLVGPFSHYRHSGEDNELATKVFSVIDPELVACAGVGGALHLLCHENDAAVAGIVPEQDRFASVAKGVGDAFESLGHRAKEGIEGFSA